MSRVSSSKRVALATSFSALYGFLRIVPIFPIVGLAGVCFPLSDVLPTVYGLLLGPKLGFMVVFTGTFLAFLLGKTPVFLGLDFIPASMNALLVGLLVKGRSLCATLLYVAILTVFMLHPLSSIAIDVNLGSVKVPIPFHWMHLLVIPVIIPPVSRRLAGWLNPPGKMAKSFLSLFTLSLSGTLCQHSSGSILWETIYGYLLNTLSVEEFKVIWATVFWLYPVERIVLAFSSTVIGVFILNVLVRFRSIIFKPPHPC